MKFEFHGNYSEEEKNLFQDAQTEDLKRICEYLKVDFEEANKKISFQIFDTREGKQELDPNHSISRASARYNEMTVYRVWIPSEDPHFPHEITHLVAHLWAKPYQLTDELDTAYGTKITKTFNMVSTSFMQEGLAVAVDDMVFGRKLTEESEDRFIDDWCREQISQMPESLKIAIKEYDALPIKIIMPFTASFSKFLINSFGIEKYKEMYALLREDLSADENGKNIESVYNINMNELYNNWKQQISSLG